MATAKLVRDLTRGLLAPEEEVCECSPGGGGRGEACSGGEGVFPGERGSGEEGGVFPEEGEGCSRRGGRKRVFPLLFFPLICCFSSLLSFVGSHSCLVSSLLSLLFGVPGVSPRCPLDLVTVFSRLIIQQFVQYVQSLSSGRPLSGQASDAIFDPSRVLYEEQ